MKTRNHAAPAAIVLSLLIGSMILRAQDPEPGWVEGVTHPISDSSLSTATDGVIGKYHAREGDRVKKGETILELDNKREQLEIIRRGVVYENAMKDVERTERLHKNTKAVSDEELEQKIAASKVAEAELNIAKEEFNRRIIKAPFDGIITDMFDLEVGAGVTERQPIIRIVDVSQGILVSTVATVGPRWKKGAKIQLRIGQPGNDVAVEGTLTYVAPVADRSSSLFKVKAVFDNANGNIRLGVPGRMRLAN